METQTSSLWQQPWWYFSLAVDFLILDQLSKYFARDYLETPITVVPDWFELRFVENTGVAFSLPVPGGVSGVLAVVVSLYLGWQIATRQHMSSVKLAYAMVMAGAIGNLIDRIWHGAVTDFIAISSFPVFNVADSFICVGVALLLWHEVMSG